MVGLDIGSKTIKIIELQEEGQNFALKASGVVGYSGVSVDKMIEDKEMATVGQIIKKLHKEAGVRSSDINISLPEQQVFTRTIKFPMLTDSEIASAVKWEAEQYIPIPVSDAIIQHTILSRNQKTVPPQVIVLLVAAPRNVVEKYTKVAQYAGLNPVAVETELIALTRALAPAGKTVLIVDMGAVSTDIAVAHDGLLSFSRSIPIAGDAFTRAVTQGIGVTPVQAEEYKKTYGLEGSQLEGKIKRTLEPVLKLIVDEIKKAIHYYQSEEKGDVPAGIIISGGTSGMLQIVPMLSELLGMEVLLGNPFSRVKMDPDTAKKLAPYAPLYCVSAGLAMRV